MNLDISGTQVVQRPATMICFPPAPTNGGKLDQTTPAKVGDWVWQPKVDDWRAVVHTPTCTVWNQYGQPSALAEREKIEAALRTLQGVGFAAEWLDVGIMEARHDMMRGSIIVFDIVEAVTPLRERLARLRSMFPVLPMADKLLAAGNVSDQVFVVNEFHQNIEHCWHGLQTINTQLGRKFYEGLVAKRLDSPYTFGRKAKQKTPDWIKHRFDQP